MIVCGPIVKDIQAREIDEWRDFSLGHTTRVMTFRDEKQERPCEQR